MRFALTEEQEMLRQSVAQVLAKSCTPTDVRASFGSAWTSTLTQRGDGHSLTAA